MAEFKLSRLKFTWKGVWSPVTQYVKDDVISYGAKTYVCLEGHTSSSNFYDELNKIETATEPDTPDPQWELMFDGYEWRGDWLPSTFYKLGDIVKYNGLTLDKFVISDSLETSVLYTFLHKEPTVAHHTLRQEAINSLMWWHNTVALSAW
jgi:hypothetical protein